MPTVLCSDKTRRVLGVMDVPPSKHSTCSAIFCLLSRDTHINLDVVYSRRDFLRICLVYRFVHSRFCIEEGELIDEQLRPFARQPAGTTTLPNAESVAPQESARRSGLACHVFVHILMVERQPPATWVMRGKVNTIFVRRSAISAIDDNISRKIPPQRQRGSTGDRGRVSMYHFLAGFCSGI